MDPKPQPHHQQYIQTLRRLTPEQRLRKAFELTALSRRLFADGLRNLHPDLPEDEFRRLYLKLLARCHYNNS